MAIKRSLKRRHRKIRSKSKVHITKHRKKILKKRAQKIAFTMKAPLQAYNSLERKIDKTWRKLRTDIKNRSRRAIIKGRRDLILLLGECNYMAKEYSRCLNAKR